MQIQKQEIDSSKGLKMSLMRGQLFIFETFV